MPNVNDYLFTEKAVAPEEIGFKKVNMINKGVESSVLIKEEVGSTQNNAGALKTSDLTSAASATAADGLKLLLVDGTTVKQITIAELKAFIGK